MSKHLTIAELSEETGLKPATLRAWESRHGFPRPLRLPGGQRRYRAEDVEAVRRVLAERVAGATLSGAIARQADAAEEHDESLFAQLTRGARLEPHLVTKRTLTRLTHAIEDECSARAERAVLVGAFQERQYYDQAKQRWLDLSRGSRCAVVFADFLEPSTPENEPAQVPIRRGDPLEREWGLIHLAPRSSALIVGREVPGQGAQLESERRFELVWSTEPAAARAGIETAVELARTEAPAVAAKLDAELSHLPSPGSLDSSFVTALTNRMIGYLGP
ncbi:MAG: MerR family DNA-binding transcriptional regulator [Actinobacteria bacterium]|nr:MerR family DNA-binding transcriptional regulator [Actinomycetota bacterium]